MPNPLWESDDEFDDGGTPMWRARQAAIKRRQSPRPITINATPAPPRDLRELWDRLTVAQCALIGYFVPMFLMGSLIVGGAIFILVYDWLERHGIIHR
ncbi:hypothetical protein [Acetobacter orientalis]|uniref:Uncharacterized protein n=1 Tax=Acetobacter orientalis TaxID=146474 RepID=A0A0D6NLF1_9PROT|nr:hypothetical protein [Acetobacter orientalis]GAN66912.1 hypothetical protein Abor_031_078 [Acetobacter orientalis]GBR14240.1 hypothetical protein AA0481_0561 [Acetobacter orientalis NRIC 0481]GEL60843.1 hypothetical protein AOR02nite_06850 [Acetobacter orientalis]